MWASACQTRFVRVFLWAPLVLIWVHVQCSYHRLVRHTPVRAHDDPRSPIGLTAWVWAPPMLAHPPAKPRVAS